MLAPSFSLQKDAAFRIAEGGEKYVILNPLWQLLYLQVGFDSVEFFCETYVNMNPLWHLLYLQVGYHSIEFFSACDV